MKNRRRRKPASVGFTLVELLTAVVIIGILASLITAAAVQAVRRARVASISTEIHQLDMAFRAYKEKYGEYPPDFTDDDATLRHVRKRWPRYNGDFFADVGNAGIQKNNLNVGSAVIFWLGGLPDAAGSKTLTGFSADPTDPIKTGGSRTPVLFDFDPDRIRTLGSTLAYVPDIGLPTDETRVYLYFRATNGQYNTFWQFRPFHDSRTGGWVNPESFQIIACGFDNEFGPYSSELQFPSGGGYGDETVDNLTNFTEGTVGDAMP